MLFTVLRIYNTPSYRYRRVTTSEQRVCEKDERRERERAGD